MEAPVNNIMGVDDGNDSDESEDDNMVLSDWGKTMEERDVQPEKKGEGWPWINKC